MTTSKMLLADCDPLDKIKLQRELVSDWKELAGYTNVGIGHIMTQARIDQNAPGYARALIEILIGKAITVDVLIKALEIMERQDLINLFDKYLYKKQSKVKCNNSLEQNLRKKVKKFISPEAAQIMKKSLELEEFKHQQQLKLLNQKKEELLILIDEIDKKKKESEKRMNETKKNILKYYQDSVDEKIKNISQQNNTVAEQAKIYNQAKEKQAQNKLDAIRAAVFNN